MRGGSSVQFLFLEKAIFQRLIIWKCIIIVLLPIVFARREIWNLASSRSRRSGGGVTNNSSNNNGHISLGQVPLLSKKFGVPRTKNDVVESSATTTTTKTTDLDTSKWSSTSIINSDSIHYSIDASTTTTTKVRKRKNVKEKQSQQKPKEKEEGSKKSNSPVVSSALLEGVVQPLIDKNIWERLTGREFEVPSVVKAFSKTGLYMTTRHSNNDYVKWKPGDKITSQAEDSKNGEDETNNNAAEKEALANGDVLIYLGTFSKEGYGSNLPLTKTRSLVPISPKSMTELLMDSSRVKSYNKMSLGRNDILVLQKGLDTKDGSFGDGETKIVRNLTKPPLTKNKMEFVTMMHARPLRKGEDDSIETDGGYLVVSRAVGGGDSWGKKDNKDNGNDDDNDDEESFVRNEILLGANLIQPTDNPDESLVTSVTHVYSPAVPVMLAGKVGSKGAVDFVKDIRNLCQ